ncbi:hypothetical protein Taro_033692, partial [Colocasia esculenta]|nr:hypothetical protein [Colocasia esculenta]
MIQCRPADILRRPPVPFCKQTILGTRSSVDLSSLIPGICDSVETEVRVGHGRVYHLQLRLEADPHSKEADPLDLGAGPLELETVPLDPGAGPLDLEAVPLEPEAGPLDLEAVPLELEGPQLQLALS